MNSVRCAGKEQNLKLIDQDYCPDVLNNMTRVMRTSICMSCHAHIDITTEDHELKTQARSAMS